MTLEHMTCQLFTPLDIYLGHKSLLLLLPKQRNTASDLYETKQQVVILDDELTFHEVCDVGAIVNSSPDEASTSHCMTSSGDQKDLHLLSINRYTILLYISLN